MTPKEKAVELLNKFKHDFYRYYVVSSDEVPFAKIGALIAIDYIIPSSSEKEHLDFWRQVKQEIEKL